MHKNTVPADVTEATVVEPDFEVLGTIDIPRGAIAGLAVSTDGSTVVATHYGDDSVSVIDADTMTTDTAVGVPGGPLFVTATERRAYVTTSTQSHDSVTVIDTRTKRVIAAHAIAGTATDVAVSPDGTRVFVGLVERDRVGLAVVNTFGRVNAINIAEGVGRTIDAVQVSPNGRIVYVATSDADQRQAAGGRRRRGAGDPRHPGCVADPRRRAELRRLAGVRRHLRHALGRFDRHHRHRDQRDHRQGRYRRSAHADGREPRRRPCLHRRLRARRRAVHRDELGRRHAYRHRRTVMRRGQPGQQSAVHRQITTAPSRSCPSRPT